MFLKNNTGWIGIDFGTSTVKLAQVVRKDKHLEIVAKAIVPRNEGWSGFTLVDTDPRSSLDELQVATSLMSEFQGRKASATLSMALCGLHRFDSMLENTPGQKARIRQALEVTLQHSAASMQFDCWNSQVTAEAPPVSQVLCMQKTWGDQLCEDIAQMRWACQSIDGMPQAFARAVQLAAPEAKSEPLAALNIGYSQSEFYAVVSGIPVYVRTLKDCGYEKFLGSICQELNVTQEEAQQLLQAHSIHPSAHENLTDTGEILREFADEYLENLKAETRRTLDFIKNQRHSVVPKQIYLFGGGATVAGMDKFLAQALEANVSNWSISSDTNHCSHLDSNPDCLFGPAIALSALAWEQA